METQRERLVTRLTFVAVKSYNGHFGLFRQSRLDAIDQPETVTVAVHCGSKRPTERGIWRLNLTGSDFRVHEDHEDRGETRLLGS